MSRVSSRITVSHPILGRVGSVADAAGAEVYVVGGYVRDRLLGKEVTDIDFVVVGDGIAFAKTFAASVGKQNVVVFPAFGTAMVHLDSGKIEFVTAREESYDPGSRKPSVRVSGLDGDLSRRDFTVNALAVKMGNNPSGEVIDLFGGLDDLRSKVLRTPLEPSKTFDDDPLRMMRAVRFASQLNFTIDPEAMTSIGAMAPRLAIVSKERITDEFMKILATPKPSTGLLLLKETGLARQMFPELADMAGVDQRKDYHHKDVYLHTAKVVDALAQMNADPWLRFAGLVHDIAKPRTKAFREGVGWTFHGHEDLGARMMKSIFQRMRLPLDRLPYIEKLIRLHLRPMALVSEEITDSAVRRLMFEAGQDVDDLMKLCRADITSGNLQRVNRYLKNYDLVIEKMKEVEEKDRIRNWQPPVKGDEIMQVCGIPPGKIVGILKQKIEDAILDGQIPNEHDAALAFLLSIKDKILQSPLPE